MLMDDVSLRSDVWIWLLVVDALEVFGSLVHRLSTTAQVESLILAQNERWRRA